MGGRHVNHIWKLLAQLNIPYVTLLDLDRERGGGGWGRVKYALKQLIENRPEIRGELLLLRNGQTLQQARLDSMHTWDVTEVKGMDSWLKRLEKYDVFFSYPLDLDFMMLSYLGDEYERIAPQGPNIPDQHESPKRICGEAEQRYQKKL